MNYFDHEKLDVYQAAIDLVILINTVVENLPRGRAYLADQLQRAGSSVPLNIAEGSGEFSANEKIRFYRMAKRSCAFGKSAYSYRNLIITRWDCLASFDLSVSRQLSIHLISQHLHPFLLRYQMLFFLNL